MALRWLKQTTLLLEDRFPRIRRPTMAERDLRQLVWHRQKLEQFHSSCIPVEAPRFSAATMDEKKLGL